MKTRYVISILTFIAMLANASYSEALTSLARTKKVTLPKPEASQVETLACINQHKVRSASITAFQYSDAQIQQPFDYAYIECKPHDEFKGEPAYFTRRCDFSDKKWTCEESDLHISVKVNNRKVNVVPGKTTPEQAEDILKKISTYGEFRRQSVDEGIGDHCRFHSTSDPEELELYCLAAIKISFWCPQPKLTHCPRVLDMGPIIYD